MMVKIYTHQGWQPAEQLDLEIAKTCSTCKNWKQDKQENRPASLRTMFVGKCKYKGETRHDETCWGWALADEDEITRREGKQ